MPQPKRKSIQVKLPSLVTQARFLPETLDQETRTVEMVFTTSNPARMSRWKGWDIEYFDEILSMDPKHIRMERMLKGAPLLNSHSRWKLSDQLGVVTSVKTEGDKLVGTVKFSKRSDVEPIFQDVVDGVIRNVSVGYQVHKYKDISKDGDKIKTLVAEDWEPLEVSLVSVPADHSAQVRELNSRSEGEDFHEATILTKDITQFHGDEEMPQEIKETVSAEAIQQAEQERCARILTSSQKAKLPDAFALDLIRKNVTLEKALQQIIDKSAENEEPVTVRTVDTNRDTTVSITGMDQSRRSAISDAIIAKHDPRAIDMEKSSAREFVGMSMLEIARRSLEMNGVRTVGMNANQIAERALHSTSDFPLVLMDAANKRTMKSYNTVKQPWRLFSSETTASDFKTINSVGLDSMDAFTKVSDSATLTYGTIDERAEKYALATYEKGMAFSRKALINDDMNAFMGIAAEFGRQAALTENKVVMGDAMLSNPKMGDGTTLFHANHGNLIAVASALDKAALSAIKLLISQQKDSKKNPAYLSAKYLLVGTGLEDTARELLFPMNQAGGPNVHGNTLELIVDPWLDITNANQFIVIADPAVIPFIEVAYLEGARGVQIDREINFDTNGLKMRGSLDFAAKALNYKAVARNLGI